MADVGAVHHIVKHIDQLRQRHGNRQAQDIGRHTPLSEISLCISKMFHRSAITVSLKINFKESNCSEITTKQFLISIKCRPFIFNLRETNR